MKRRSMIVLLAAAALFATGMEAHAGRRWVAQARYDTPVAGACVSRSGQNACVYAFDCPEALGCARVKLKKPVALVDIEVIDATGLPVRADIYIPGGGKIADICGKSTDAVPIYGASEVWVHAIPGDCLDGTPSSPTRGVAKVAPAKPT